ncbi:MAG TPA: hypothetical protein PLG77_06540 [Burkholderiaceae bacterium]|nr:hypothetical protein [Burkholderiaceae bacterium]HRP28072.1 hypothetical protein [Burkholderiaceae bacterium]
MKAIALLFAAAGLALAGAASGQIVGELAASPISRFNADDNRLLLGAIDKALADNADGTTLAWKSEQTPAQGSVTPRRSFTADHMACRELEIATRYRARSAQSVHTFCRDSAGAWKLRS